MKFQQVRNPLTEVEPGKFVIGNDPLNPELIVGGGEIEIPSTLKIEGIDFKEYITGDVIVSNTILNNYTSGRHTLEEAFELDAEGDIVPSNAQHISDSMWILRSDNDLELKNNLWRYNTGPDAFTDEISF